VTVNMDPTKPHVLHDSYLTRGVRRVDALATIFEAEFEPHKVLSHCSHTFAARAFAALEKGGGGPSYVRLPPAATNFATLTGAHLQLVRQICRLDPDQEVVPPHVYRRRLEECEGLSNLIALFHELTHKGRDTAKPLNFHVAASYYAVCLHHYMATGNVDWLGKRHQGLLDTLSLRGVALHCTSCEQLGHLAGQPACKNTPKPSGGGGGGGYGGGRGPGPRAQYRASDAPGPNARGAPAPPSNEAWVPRQPPEHDSEQTDRPKGKRKSKDKPSKP
jgi:hypothetical protein